MIRNRTFDEWLEPDGLGGFASGTVTGERTRRYHALLLVSEGSATNRIVLVNGYEASIRIGQDIHWLSTHRYLPDIVHPKPPHIVAFRTDPWPAWRYRLTEGVDVLHEVLVLRRGRTVAMRWRLDGYVRSAGLRVRPLLSGRGCHDLHRENPDFRFDVHSEAERVLWQPYDGLPIICCHTNGRYLHGPVWYRNFMYTEDRDRGLDFVEDLASPGSFTWDLLDGEAVWILHARSVGSAEKIPEHPVLLAGEGADPVAVLRRMREHERRRRKWFPTSLHRAADAYIIETRRGPGVIAGYPWAGEDGRHTFIALRGLSLATGRLVEAARILGRWAETISDDARPSPGGAESIGGAGPADTALWFIVTCGEFLGATERWDLPSTAFASGLRDRLAEIVHVILGRYAGGAWPGVRLDDDGLLAAGETNVPMTCMDATVGDRIVTPRIGKPVELQALWMNALEVGRRFDRSWARALARARRAFPARFWNSRLDCLFDVIDVNHEPGNVDPSLRPNQILAVGGLPLPVLDVEPARAVVDIVERRLWTPLGLRSLDRDDPAYRPQCVGSIEERSYASHQGSAWCWLLGPFAEAWLRVRGGTEDARREARRRFVEPVLTHLGEGGLGHVSGLTDGEPPYTPRGCPFQACSVGEALRFLHITLPDRGSTEPLPGSLPGLSHGGGGRGGLSGSTPLTSLRATHVARSSSRPTA